MRALAEYIMRGRLQAIAVASLLTMVSMLLPLFAYVLSGVPIALISLRRGGRIGMQVILGTLAVVALFSWPAGIDPMIAPAFAVSIWLPVWLCAGLLRLTESQGVVVLAAGAMGALFVVFMHLMVNDVTAWWKAWFDAWIQHQMPADSVAQYKQLLASAMPLMNAMMAAGLVVGIIVTLMLARSWQSALYNPGGFRQEFYRLRLPRWLGVVTLAVTALALVRTGLDQGMFRDLVVVLVFLYLFQGVACVHRWVAGRGMSSGWLLGMYVLLLIMPQLILFVACVGMADSWLVGQKPLR